MHAHRWRGGTRETTDESGRVKKKEGKERGAEIIKRKNKLNKVLKAEKYFSYLVETKTSGKTRV